MFFKTLFKHFMNDTFLLSFGELDKKTFMRVRVYFDSLKSSEEDSSSLLLTAGKYFIYFLFHENEMSHKPLKHSGGQDRECVCVCLIVLANLSGGKLLHFLHPLSFPVLSFPVVSFPFLSFLFLS